jgi:hypothetical protein
VNSGDPSVAADLADVPHLEEWFTVGVPDDRAEPEHSACGLDRAGGPGGQLARIGEQVIDRGGGKVAYYAVR